MKKNILKFIEIALTIALVGFIIFKAGAFFNAIEWSSILNAWFGILIAAILFTTGYAIFAHHWLLVCRLIQPNTLAKQHLAFFASQPYKYLPTSLFTLSFRAKFASQLGMNLRDSSEAQVIENLNLVGGALLVGGILLAVLYAPFVAFISLAIVGFMAALLWTQQTVTIPKLKTKINIRQWIKTFIIVVFGWVVVGLGFAVVVFSIDQKFEPLASIAANSIATGLGILAIFAPGGIGVRELVFSFFMYSSTAIIIWRFITFIIDIVVGLVSMILIAKRH